MRLVAFQRWALFTLVYMVAVILWGAFVRATGSGAGCGDHWPLCNGVVVPRAPASETLIELTHRLTSGLSLIFVVVLFFFARRVAAVGHPLRRASAWALGFIIAEALIGAGLVLFELVAHNASLKRMFSMSAHLLNTFALLVALCLCIWRSSEAHPERVAAISQLKSHPLTLATGALLVLTGMTGAIAALGDTLYAGFGPIPLQAYLDGEVPVLLRLRLIHPVFAIVTSVVVLFHQASLWKQEEGKLFSALGWSVSFVTLLQLGLGFINVQLMAPVWMQLLHLGVGVLLWILFSFSCFLVFDKNLK